MLDCRWRQKPGFRARRAGKKAPARMRAPGRIADAVAAALVSETDERLALLEELRVDRRLDRLIDTVAGMLLGAPEGGAPVASA